MKYFRDKLDNGITYITVPMNHLDSTTVSVWVKAGSRHEDTKIAGVSHFLEHIVFKGTKTRPSHSDIVTHIDSIGADQNAATSHEWTTYYVKLRSKLLEEGFKHLSDLLDKPLLREVDIAKEKGVIIEEIAWHNDSPTDKVANNFMGIMYPKHPLGMDIAGTRESILGLTKSDIESYKEGYYVTNNMIVVVAGGADHKNVAELSKTYFSGFRKGEISDPQKFSSKQKMPTVNLERRETQQAHIVLGFRSGGRDSQSKEAEEVLSIILGRGMSSRLFVEVRENRSLAYAVGTSVDRFVDTGVFETYIGAEIKKAKEALRVTLDEHEKLKDRVKKISQKELSKAKEYFKGRFALALENTTAVNSYFGQEALLTKKIEVPDELYERINKVTVEDVYKAAEDVFKLKNLNIAILGPYEDDSDFRSSIGI